MKTIEELKKEYDEKLAALRKEKTEALKKAKAETTKKSAAQRERLRKQDAHIKILFGSYMLSEMKAGKSTVPVSGVLQFIKKDTDRELVKPLFGELGFDKKSK